MLQFRHRSAALFPEFTGGLTMVTDGRPKILQFLPTSLDNLVPRALFHWRISTHIERVLIHHFSNTQSKGMGPEELT